MRESIIKKIWAEKLTASKYCEVESFLNKFDESDNFVIDGDFEFLSAACGSVKTQPFRESFIALQFLTSLAEDGYFSENETIDILIENLYHELGTSRNKAAECLWQLGAKWALNDLKFVLANESKSIVRRTLEHVIRVLS